MLQSAPTPHSTFFSAPCGILNCQKSKLKFSWVGGEQSARLHCGHSPFTSGSQKQDPFPAHRDRNHQHQDESPHPAPSVPPGPGADFPETEQIWPANITPGDSRSSTDSQLHIYKPALSSQRQIQPCLGALWHRSEDSVAQGTGMFPSVALVSALPFLPGADPDDGWSKVKDAEVKLCLSIPGSLNCFPPTTPLLFTHAQRGLCSAWLAHT